MSDVIANVIVGMSVTCLRLHKSRREDRVARGWRWVGREGRVDDAIGPS